MHRDFLLRERPWGFCLLKVHWEVDAIKVISSSTSEAMKQRTVPLNPVELWTDVSPGQRPSIYLLCGKRIQVP